VDSPIRIEYQAFAAWWLQDKDVIFMETAVRLENARTHACIEAVPLPAKAFAKAPLYFKKVGRG
jgi:hypothetical protein